MARPLQEALSRIASDLTGPDATAVEPLESDRFACGCPMINAQGHARRPHACCTCDDGKFLRLNLTVGQQGFGRVVPCPNCSDPDRDPESHEARFERTSRIPPLYHNIQIDGFEPLEDPAAREAAIAFIDAWPRPPVFLTFESAHTGNGKTLLACAILTTLWRTRRVIGRFEVVDELLQRYRDIYEDASWEQQDSEIPALTFLRTSLRAAPVLVLDDLGAEQATDWARAQMTSLINWRYTHGRPTIITTNNGAAIDERIASRLAAGRIVEFTGGDRRGA